MFRLKIYSCKCVHCCNPNCLSSSVLCLHVLVHVEHLQIGVPMTWMHASSSSDADFSRFDTVLLHILRLLMDNGAQCLSEEGNEHNHPLLAVCKVRGILIAARCM